MSLNIVTHKKDWIDRNEFLQSWDYGEFLRTTGRDILRVRIDTHDATSYIQGVITQQRYGIVFCYIPRAVFNTSPHAKEFFDFAKKQGYAFVRCEYGKEITLPTSIHAYPTKHRQPQDSWFLNITPPCDTLLLQMHSKTRYNIKLAEKKGVQIDEEKNIDLFWDVHLTTTQRNNYVPHPKEYIEKLLKLPSVYQINARYNDTILASAIILHHHDTIYYYFGASSNEYRNFMGPYLMHYHIIQLGKKLGCTTYDWWGMASSAQKGSGTEECYHNVCWQKDHPFAGVARFKVGFGGYFKSYPTAQEWIVLPMRYAVYRGIQLFRRNRIVGHPIR